MSNTFIKASYGIIPTCETKYLIHIIEYSAESYSDIEFVRTGIECPEQIRISAIKRKSECLAGRYAAKLALRAEGIDNVQVKIGTQREPLWPVGIVGSISHCTNIAACSAFRPSEKVGAGVGIDVEAFIDIDTVEQIQDQILCAEDAQLALSNLSKEQAAKRFTQVFSPKESLYKALFPRVRSRTFIDRCESV